MPTTMQPLLRHLDAAYHWLCHQRRGFPATADVWHLRQHWLAERQQLQAELLAGTVPLGPLSIITPTDGEPLHLWCARDALVLKALTLALAPRLAHRSQYRTLQYAGTA
jgi:RNA-directed DNA polymerase